MVKYGTTYKTPGTSRTKSTVLVQAAIAVMKHHGPRQLGEEGFISLTAPHSSSSAKTAKAGTQAGLMQELMQKPW